MKQSITTLCLNPALDVTYHVHKLIADQKARTDSARYDPGGNGINIGRALNRMEIDSTTFCIIAGEVGQILKSLIEPQLSHVVYEEVTGQTRINSTIIELDTHTQYQLAGSGTPIAESQLQNIIADFIEKTANGYGIITGSCQPNIAKTQYADLVRQINDNGGRAVVDTHGEMLKHAIDAGPFLIKPNQYELETLMHVKLNSHEAIAHAARQIQQQGVAHVCVSLGHEGAILVSPNNSFYARSLDVPVNTTVGAGDSMVAGLVAGFSLYDEPQQALRYGMACGAGTVMHPGTELFNGEQLADFRSRVNIERLGI